MTNTIRIGFIIMAMWTSPRIWAVVSEAAQQCKVLRGNSDLSIQHCTTAIQSGALSPEELVAVLYKRALAHYHKGDFDPAISDLNTVIGLKSNDARFYVMRAMAYEYSVRNYDEAIKNFTMAIQLEPNNHRFYNYRCWALTLNGQADFAIADCTQSLELEPNNPNTLDSRGLAHFALGNYTAALQDYNRTIELDPEAWSTHLNRSRVFEKLGKQSKADADRALARNNAKDDNQYNTWLGSLTDAEKNNRHHLQ